MTNNELCHYGIRGQKWGVRRYQNEDGSYKPGAEGRYSQDSGLRSIRGRSGSAKPIGQTSEGHNVYSFGYRRGSAKSIGQTSAGQEIYSFGTRTRRSANAGVRTEAARPIGKTSSGQDVYKFGPNRSGNGAVTPNRISKGNTPYATTTRARVHATQALVDDAKSMIASGRLSAANFASMADNDFKVYLEEITGEDSSIYTDQEIAAMRDAFNRQLGLTKNARTKATEDKYDKLADEVIQGKYGNGEERKKLLGEDYEEIQKRVNKRLSHSGFTYTDELYHFGVKGMKWGVWNDETRQRYLSKAKGSKAYKVANKAKPYIGKATSQTIKNGKDKPNISPLEKDIQETKKIMSTIRDMRSGRGGSKRVRKKGYKEPNELSNEELRKYIERLNLEKSYDSLTMKDVKTGMDYAEDILSIAGSVASIAAVTYMIFK